MPLSVRIGIASLLHVCRAAPASSGSQALTDLIIPRANVSVNVDSSETENARISWKQIEINMNLHYQLRKI